MHRNLHSSRPQKNFSLLFCALLFLATVPRSGAQTSDPYAEKLEAGDAKSAAGDFAGAASDYGAAISDAKTPTQEALALGKQAMALVQKQDFSAAQEAVDRALAKPSVEPVAEVTVLQASAKCQLHEKNFTGALESLVRADSLSGVDWAKAEIAMIRGDAERGAGKFGEATATYRRVLEMPDVSDGFKGVAWLNIGLTEQYSLNNASNAKEAYAKAVQLNPGLKAEVDGHSAKMH